MYEMLLKMVNSGGQQRKLQRYRENLLAYDLEYWVMVSETLEVERILHNNMVFRSLCHILSLQLDDERNVSFSWKAFYGASWLLAFVRRLEGEGLVKVNRENDKGIKRFIVSSNLNDLKLGQVVGDGCEEVELIDNLQAEQEITDYSPGKFDVDKEWKEKWD
jgi:hypothetical protein